MTTFITTGLVEQLSEVATAVETVPRRHGRRGSRVTKLASRKNRSVVVCATPLEAAFWLKRQRGADVNRYVAQPFTLKFTGINYYLVSFSDGSQRLVEVKPAIALSTRAGVQAIQKPQKSNPGIYADNQREI
ncbi:hypothetical protein GKKCFE_19580 [Pseudomonas sp. E141]|uniref:hypothetical protein n=1 Tax=Pseudomonas sp. E141 TaxID=2875961 RepID=UPI0040458C16